MPVISGKITRSRIRWLNLFFINNPISQKLTVINADSKLDISVFFFQKKYFITDMLGPMYIDLKFVW